jgi:hypothetical protein
MTHKLILIRRRWLQKHQSLNLRRMFHAGRMNLAAFHTGYVA